MEIDFRKSLKNALELLSAAVGVFLVGFFYLGVMKETNTFWLLIIAIIFVVCMLGFLGNITYFILSLGRKTTMSIFSSSEREKNEINKKIESIYRKVSEIKYLINIANNQKGNDSTAMVIKTNNLMLEQLYIYLDRYEANALDNFARYEILRMESRKHSHKDLEKTVKFKEEINKEYLRIRKSSILTEHPVLFRQYEKITQNVERIISNKLVQRTKFVISKESPVMQNNKYGNDLFTTNTNYENESLNQLNYEYDRYIAELDLSKGNKKVEK